MSETIVSAQNLTYHYDEKVALKNIQLEIKKGSFVALIGPNGGGKTTFIKIILGLLTPDHGSIDLFQQPLHSFKQWSKIGFVSQKANAFNKGFPATVFEVVSMGLTAKIGYFKFFRRKHREKIMQAIEQVGLQAYARENISHLSGGQQQRAFIARALVSEPQFLILDEPTVGVDDKNVEKFYKLLHELNKNQLITFLVVTHELEPLLPYVSDVIGLQQTICFQGSAQQYQSLTKTERAEIFSDL